MADEASILRVAARDLAVRDLADHLQPTGCQGCAECGRRTP